MWGYNFQGCHTQQDPTAKAAALRPTVLRHHINIASSLNQNSRTLSNSQHNRPVMNSQVVTLRCKPLHESQSYDDLVLWHIDVVQSTAKIRATPEGLISA